MKTNKAVGADEGFKKNEPAYKQEHTMSLISLCWVIFSFGYVVISVFPYSGFMAIDLVESANEENAGYYAGLISSAFMAGRALTSYHWGKAADTYGRVTVLLTSLVFSMVFSILFGLSKSFSLALLWRFLLGFTNGLMGTVKTIVSEIADGDKTLETRGMGIIVGMWGWSLLASPAISGAIVQPTEQYPGLWEGHEGTAIYKFMQKYPFFLANLFGAILCFVSIFMVLAHVQETLPSAQWRHPKHIPNDVLRSLKTMLSTIPEVDEDELDYLSESPNPAIPQKDYGAVRHTSSQLSEISEDDIQLPQQILDFAENDIDDSVRRSVMSQNEESILLSTSNMRGELTHSIAKRSSIVAEQRRMSRMTLVPEQKTLAEIEEAQEATIASLWAKINTRNHLIVYWLGNFIMVAVDEGLPLFLLSREGGLALSAKAIGTILSASGGMFVMLQYVTYARMVDFFGLYGTMRIGAISMAPFIALFPIVLILNQKGKIALYGAQPAGEDEAAGEEYGDLTWAALIYLSGLTAIYRVFFMAFLSSLMVGMNRTVIPSHRGTMNGLCTLGGSVTKAIGPSFAGLLVAFSLSSGFFPPSLGAVVLFLVLAVVGAAVTLTTLCLLQEEEEE